MAKNYAPLKVPRSKYSLTIPQVYDDTLTFYEYMNKLLYAFQHSAEYAVSTDYNADEKHLTITIKSLESEE